MKQTNTTHQGKILYGNQTSNTVRVWDLPTRIFHWALVICIIGLGISGSMGGSNLVWHFRFGYALLTLLLFRIVWGLAGGHWSRFKHFIYAPKTLVNALKGTCKPAHSVGHSPLGAISVFTMLAMLLTQVGSGLFSNDDIAFAGPLTHLISNESVSFLTNYHSNIGKWLLLALILLHIGAIFLYQKRRHKLIEAMLHGDKELLINAASSRDDAVSRLYAALIFIICALFVTWLTSLKL